MKVLKNNKGQAAIEFLMTYGWMLLVVLIVGALIFSFVNFASLLPNKIGLGNNLRGLPESSVAFSGTSAQYKNQVKVVFQYIGANRISISPVNNTIKTTLGNECNSSSIKNLATSAVSPKLGSNQPLPFLNGQTALMNFNCTPSVPGGLLTGDSLQGSISIGISNPLTGLTIPSVGDIRLQVTK